eukprot:2209439-Amphidinium_carterae.1
MRGQGHWIPRNLTPESFRELVRHLLPQRSSLLQDIWQPSSLKDEQAILARMEAEHLAQLMTDLTAAGFGLLPNRDVQATTDVIWLPRTTASLPEAQQSAAELLDGIAPTLQITDPQGLTWTWSTASALFARQHQGKVSFGLRIPKTSGRVHSRAGQDPRPQFLLTGTFPAGLNGTYNPSSTS